MELNNNENMEEHNEDIKVWKQKVMSDDDIEKIDALENIPNIKEDQIIPILFLLAKDKNPLVRTLVAEAMGSYNNEETRIKLLHFIETEKDELIRAFAISSLGQITEKKDDISLLLDFVHQENHLIIKAHAVYGLAVSVCTLCTTILSNLQQNNKNDIKYIATKVLGELLSVYENNNNIVLNHLSALLGKETDQVNKNLIKSILTDFDVDQNLD